MPDIKITTPSTRPKCPNHGCPLDGCGFPLPKKGTGICQISGARFDFEVDTEDAKGGVKKDKFGNITKDSKWKVKGND